jgi:hypothetical protein
MSGQHVVLRLGAMEWWERRERLITWVAIFRNYDDRGGDQREEEGRTGLKLRSLSVCTAKNRV